MTDRECVLEIIRIAAGCEAYPLIHDRCEAVLREHVARATAEKEAELDRLTGTVAALRHMHDRLAEAWNALPLDEWKVGPVEIRKGLRLKEKGVSDG